MSELLNRVRCYELETVRNLFASDAAVVEIGAGNGYQASIIASWGCTVAAFDVAGREAPSQTYHEVADYDGAHLPLADSSIDVVFSSNVLEHVRCLSALLGETFRVLKPGGIAVHILPTPHWRFWSIVAHYPFLAFTALGIPTGFVDWSDKEERQTRTSERGVPYLIKRVLWPGPHGEFPSAIAEFAGFRARHWTQELEKAGFTIDRVWPTGIYYSGYGLFANLSIAARRRMGRFLGSSTQTIVARKPDRPLAR